LFAGRGALFEAIKFFPSDTLYGWITLAPDGVFLQSLSPHTPYLTLAQRDMLGERKLLSAAYTNQTLYMTEQSPELLLSPLFV
jgi:hypothetical protein